MTDERMDARLRAAGEHWRAGNDASSTVDTGNLLTAGAPDDIVDIQPEPRGRTRRTWLAVAASVAAVLVAAGVLVTQLRTDSPSRPTATDNNGSTTLQRTEWRLVNLNLRLMIDEGHLVADDGCNTMSGDVRIDGDRIEIGNLATTEMACLNPPAALATASAQIHAVLSGTAQWSINGDELTLTKGSESLTYRRAPDPVTDPVALRGTRWQLSEVTHASSSDNDGAVSSPAQVEPSTLTFDGNATSITVNQACHGFTAPVRSSAGKLAIEPYIIDTMACADNGLPGIYRDTVTWVIDDGNLTIIQAGVGKLVYRPAG